MINDQVGWTDGINLVGISVQLKHSITHRSKVYYSRDTGKVLQNDTGRLKGHLDILFVAFLALDRLPVEDVGHILLSHLEVVTVAHGGLEQDADGEGKLICKKEMSKCKLWPT